MEFFMSIAVAVLFLATGCLAGIFWGALATVRILQTRYPQTWYTFLIEREAKIETRRQWPK